jgi:hypothetical protein
VQELTGRRARRGVAIASIALLQACVVVPRSTQFYDPQCQVMANRMVLEEVQIAAIQHCANEGCVAMVLAAGLVTAASVMISGTIVVAGNIAHWFERRAGCVRLAPVVLPHS